MWKYIELFIQHLIVILNFSVLIFISAKDASFLCLSQSHSADTKLGEITPKFFLVWMILG